MTLEEINKEIQMCRDNVITYSVASGKQYAATAHKRQKNSERLSELLSLKKTMEAMKS